MNKKPSLLFVHLLAIQSEVLRSAVKKTAQFVI